MSTDERARAAGELRLRPLGPGDEAVFRDALAVMATEDFNFGFGYDAGLSWADYLRRVDDHRRGLNLPPGFVPDTFLVADVAGTVVGRVSIRHELNDKLRREGGHIGYCVLPGYRRRGYATEILRQGLIIARSLGIDRVLMFVDDDNTGSIAVIERGGGRLDAVVPGHRDGTPMRRYWID